MTRPDRNDRPTAGSTGARRVPAEALDLEAWRPARRERLTDVSADPAAGPFRILHVCTGNVCRSPYAEILTRHLLLERLGGDAVHFQVASAGVGAVVGSGMHPETRGELALWGLHAAAADAFVARQLEPGILAGADLVLGATTAHRSAVVKLAPRALPVTFSLREFARLAASVDRAALPDDPVARARTLVQLARAQRGMTPPGGPDADQVPDPIGQTVAAHRQAATLMDEAIAAIVDVLTP